VPSYVVKKDWRIWTADSPGELVAKLRADLAPACPSAADFMRTWPDRATLPAGQAVRADTAANWLADLIKIGRIRKAPNFDAAVNVILATFAVFTGLTLTTFLAPPTTPPIDIGNFCDWHWWGIFALVALLLRYVIGSAIHLNHVYAGEQPRSISVLLLFKDLMFLVFFGILAFYIIEAPDAANFVRRAMLFVLAGFAWSIVDYYARRVWCVCIKNDRGDRLQLRFIDGLFFVVFAALVLWTLNPFHGRDIDGFLTQSVIVVLVGILFCFVNFSLTPENMPEREWPAPFWRLWTCLDGGQFLATALLVCAVPSAPDKGLSLIRLLAILYIGFLLADMFAMIRAVQSNSK
jgi:hypothetical protein